MSKNREFDLPTPDTAPELFDQLLTRRVAAFFIDLFILLIIVSGVIFLGFVAGVVSFGLAIPGLVFAIPLSVVFYYAATLGSEKRATYGMSAMDIVLTPVRGGPLDGWKAFAHPMVYWLTAWILPPFSMIVALFTPRRQMIHDYIMGTLMVRRSPMESHWQEFSET